jgi:hypothetical protein
MFRWDLNYVPLILSSRAERGVSKDARNSSWFETRRCATLLTMKGNYLAACEPSS